MHEKAIRFVAGRPRNASISCCSNYACSGRADGTRDCPVSRSLIVSSLPEGAARRCRIEPHRLSRRQRLRSHAWRQPIPAQEMEAVLGTGRRIFGSNYSGISTAHSAGHGRAQSRLVRRVRSDHPTRVQRGAITGLTGSPSRRNAPERATTVSPSLRPSRISTWPSDKRPTCTRRVSTRLSRTTCTSAPSLS
jgi:hypothetical protein